MALSLMATVAIGSWLRLWLAGLPLPLHHFGNLRHVHTHLGYYGVLFPLMWLAWRQRGLPVPGRRTLGVYALATVVGALGFGLQGYGPFAIAGSTAVLAIWLASAWQGRGVVRRGGGWMSTVPLGIVLGAAVVPLVAMNAGTPRASVVVRSFLGMLLLLTLLPTALAHVRARPFPTLGWLGAGALGAVSLGLWEDPRARAGLLVAGVLLGLSGSTARQPWELRAAWVLAAAGLVAVGADLVPLSTPVAVAGTHFLILGPLLHSLWPLPLGAAARGLLLALLALMCTAILLTGRVAGLDMPLLTALSGVALALGWSLVALRGALSLPKAP